MKRSGIALLIALLAEHLSAQEAQPPREAEDRVGRSIQAEIGGKTSELAIKPDADVNVTMDLNFDGVSDERDDALEEKRSMIVVANVERSYEKDDPFDEPARRKQLTVKSTVGSVTLTRSSPNVRLFRGSKGGQDMFPPNGNTIRELSIGDYWVEGGAAPSKTLGGEWIEVEAQHSVRGKPLPTDRVKITILWVDLKPKLDGANASLLPPPLYEHLPVVLRQQGHALLGLHRSEANSQDGPVAARGNVQFVGQLHPPIKASDRNAFGRPITSGLSKTEKGVRATAEFGFIFRRLADYVWYNGGKRETPRRTNGFVPDDSREIVQDTNPDWDDKDKRSVIADNDGPGLNDSSWDELKKARILGLVSDCKELRPLNIFHLRDNFTTYVVFQSVAALPPERVSAKRKYSFSTDVGFDTKDQATFLFDPPNDGKGANEFIFDKHLDFADPATFQLPPSQIARVSLVKVDGAPVKQPGAIFQLPYNGMITLRVSGQGLAGRFSLIEDVPGDPREVRSTIVTRVQPSGHEFSNVSEVELTFCTGFTEKRDAGFLRPSVFPYLLKFTNLDGEIVYHDAKFVFPRQPLGPRRAVRIKSITPKPKEIWKGEQFITLENTLNAPQTLTGWKIYRVGFKSQDVISREFGEGEVVLPAKASQQINIGHPQKILPDPSDPHRGALVYLLGRNNRIEDFVAYKDDQVQLGKEIDTFLGVQEGK